LCKKTVEEPSTNELNNSLTTETKYGDAIFWQQKGSGFDITVVNINGVTSSITSEYDSTPACGSSGCAVFNQLETGSYSFTAGDAVGNAWSGTVDITEDSCATMKLQ
jgi:hypothetical protein